jgi:hypothetical protein
VASTATTESTPTTTPPPTPATPPPTQSTPKPKPKPPPPTPRRHHTPLPPGSGSETVETVTNDGNVLVLGNGDVYSTSDDASSWENEAVHVSEDESKITKADNGEQLEVSKVGDTSSGESYSGTGDEQDTNSSDGAILVLNDGSVWAVENADQATARLWQDRAAIHVSEEESGGGLGTYVLTNTDEHESVTATHIGEK